MGTAAQAGQQDVGIGAPRYPEVEVNLVGVGSHLLAVLDRCRRAVEKAELPKAVYTDFYDEATGDYDDLVVHALRTMTEWFTVITDAAVPANESIEDYLTRLEAALEPQGDFWEMELVGQMVETRSMGGVDSSDPEGAIRASVAKEIELQLRDIELWRDDLAVQVTNVDWDCFEVQNGGLTLIGTLAVRFTVSADGIALWSAGANIFCEHSLEDDLEDDEELDELDELPDDEVEDWWLAHGVDVWEVTDFRCRWIDIGEVEVVLVPNRQP
jgi:hypothetical protein